MFQCDTTPIPGCFVIRPKVFTDARGALVKVFHEGCFQEIGLGTEPGEIYYSVSKKGALRGLHFQEPPHAQDKLVGCLGGRIFDAVVDLRRGSPAYGQHFAMELDAESCCLLYVPAGVAHGFCALTEGAVFLNRANAVYSPDSDRGVRWDSCGITWPSGDKILSEKDQGLPILANYESPFSWVSAGSLTSR
jgi:dTDP-4-dehydrorhamnose 3,5-epimerase